MWCVKLVEILDQDSYKQDRESIQNIAAGMFSNPLLQFHSGSHDWGEMGVGGC